MKGAGFAGQALGDNFGILVNQNRHLFNLSRL
jgi:hypothetical protein